MSKSNLYLSEMIKEERDFLMKIIRENRPRKVVEVGIAAGGTGKEILEQLEENGNQASMFSVDLAEYYYQDKTKKSGFILEEYKSEHKLQVKHELITGVYLPQVLEKIGTEIDLLILDTVHRFPGEILDFLAALPYLKRGGIVVLHDIELHQAISEPDDGYATQILIDSVVGDKITPIQIGHEYPNIGAFVVTDDTKKYIEDAFCALTITWGYRPSDTEITLYRNWYKRFYDERLLWIFDEAVRMNKNTLDNIRHKKDEFITTYGNVYKEIKFLENKKVYIYGNGVYGKRLREWLVACGIAIKKMVVTARENVDEDVICIDELNLSAGDVLVIGTNNDKHAELVGELTKRGIDEYVIPSDDFLKILKTSIK